jgi:hypothetical protein
MFQTNSYTKSKHTFYPSINFSENPAVYETMWRNFVQTEATNENTIRGMRSS